MFVLSACIFYAQEGHAVTSLITPDIGAIDGSVILGSSILAAGDRSSLLSAAGLNDFNGIVASPDSPFVDYNEVKIIANSLNLLQSSSSIQQVPTSSTGLTGTATVMDSPYMPSQVQHVVGQEMCCH